ncbi:hypothetical protein Pcinc_000238 [Petrolisthes cinctipes]|uniref:Uncharacterized protein n=1 Tax=Petrolisthes cinctipes TaxID=88211 RepID=A0AAE1GNN9_PETCI|nr:hypothetical protein Pcinc_000238 [Petrolisthes cinctipes]
MSLIFYEGVPALKNIVFDCGGRGYSTVIKKKNSLVVLRTHPSSTLKPTPVRIHCHLVRATSTTTRHVFSHDATSHCCGESAVRSQLIGASVYITCRRARRQNEH